MINNIDMERYIIPVCPDNASLLLAKNHKEIRPW